MNHINLQNTDNAHRTSNHVGLEGASNSSHPDRIHTGLNDLLENARREATALAWSTGFPFLTLPCLQEELESEATKYSSKQTQIQQRSSSLLNKTFPMVSQLLAA